MHCCLLVQIHSLAKLQFIRKKLHGISSFRASLEYSAQGLAYQQHRFAHFDWILCLPLQSYNWMT